MAYIGSIEEYQEGESWSQYHERLEFYMDANGVNDAKKVAVFLSVCGPKCYGLLRNLIAPVHPSQLYHEISLNYSKRAGCGMGVSGRGNMGNG